MEEMLKQSKTAPSPLSMHNDSHVISKFKPKIRIVHIFAPEIIKTDVANFREIVQRLTGKPPEQKSSKKKGSTITNQESRTMKTTETDDGYRSSKCECENSSCGDVRIKDEEEAPAAAVMWQCENSSYFFDALGDLDGFIQGIGEFPLVPFNVASPHLGMFGETHLC